MSLLAALVTWSMAGCSRHETPPAPPNVLLITLDTVRADHMSSYDYHRATSPRVTEFATGATFYSKAMASAPWTVPTHASLFTGMDPFEHGAHTVETTSRVNNINPLDDSHLTLAEALRREGYTTGAFVANDAMLATRWQLDQGFETYHIERTMADELNLRVFSWLDSVSAAGTPFFLFVNYIDAHSVYNTKPRPGLLPRPVVQDNGELVKQLTRIVMPGVHAAPKRVAEKVIDQYDTAIANVDDQVGVLIDHLRQLGVYDETTIVVTSDHGEFLGEHRLVGHSKDVYQEVLWVPLVIKGPSQREGRREDGVVSTSDVPRLVLNEFPREIRKRNESKFPNAPGNHPIISENYYTRVKDLYHRVWGKRFNRVRTVIYEWPYKYIDSSDGKSELYDLALDEKESTNLVTDKPETAKKMRNRLHKYMKTRPRYQSQSAPPTLTEDEIKKLKSLGYIGN